MGIVWSLFGYGDDMPELESQQVEAMNGDLSEILPGELYLSSMGCIDHRFLRDERGITAVLTIKLDPMEPATTRGLVVKHLRQDDSPLTQIRQHFEEGHAFIDEHRKNGGVVVHCAAGVSRSATMVISYVMQSERLPLREAFHRVRDARSRICPNTGFIKELIEYEAELGLTTDGSRFFLAEYIVETRLHGACEQLGITKESLTQALEDCNGDINSA
eukprot:CAMPEP_0119121602 /NCGR_PEP_ID=MMETSP1310-20130426/2157_1 /TAXON_ID=464262 /ORGANISM="Genus nov. species nov., Strain RCC2339" /LENGTH=216 /DNA_ID=CAMNT_0007111173 /DNA_START=114 /DNA_END=761 /DNA_ORIENTATION=+